MSLFEQATRLKLRFTTSQGHLSTEDLWDLPLTSANQGKANLDDIAKMLHRQIRESFGAESFVTPAVTKEEDEQMQLRFEVVKHVIDVKVTERNARADAEKKRSTKQRILEIIDAKQDESLRGKSIDELKQLADSL